uniref:Uncharacterized protein n=1 Tax=Spermophilus dauricus TaxID=99837 RepID=A0A8C9PWR5_SPEDA
SNILYHTKYLVESAIGAPHLYHQLLHLLFSLVRAGSPPPRGGQRALKAWVNSSVKNVSEKMWERNSGTGSGVGRAGWTCAGSVEGGKARRAVTGRAA